MNLEDRLRAELDRSGRSTMVGISPSIDEIASVANERRHRNRVLGASGAVILSSALLFGAFFAAQPGTSTLDVAGGGDAAPGEVAESDIASSAEAAPDAASAPVDATAADVDSEQDSTDAAPNGETADERETTVADDSVDENEASSDDAEQEPTNDVSTDTAGEVDLVAAYGAALLQVDDTNVQVQSRRSAVGLASGSGVLVVADDSGYRGLATAFGNDTETVVLTSPNGLDWTGSEAVGVPTGATASILREYNGTFVALFERFDQNAGIKRVQIGTSTDMVTWDVSAPLAGSEVYATDLAVGSPGVIVIGDDQSPQVWSGPIGGPYQRTGRIPATMLNGVTTLDGEFLVAGRSREAGVALFSSADGVDWEVRSLSSADEPGSARTASVDNGTVVLRSQNDTTAATLISNDAGVTWSALPASSNRGVSVSASTMGFLGNDGSGAVVAVADDDTFSTAQIDVAAPDRLAVVAAGDGELLMVQTTESGTTWILASR